MLSLNLNQDSVTRRNMDIKLVVCSKFQQGTTEKMPWLLLLLTKSTVGKQARFYISRVGLGKYGLQNQFKAGGRFVKIESSSKVKKASDNPSSHSKKFPNKSACLLFLVQSAPLVFFQTKPSQFCFSFQLLLRC